MRFVGDDFRVVGVRALGMAVLVGLIAVLVTGSAAAATNKKIVDGTVYDTTCAGVACGVECPPPPHCGPITAEGKTGIVCPMSERMIACPLSKATVIVCVQAEGCPETGSPPVWSGEGGVVTVRKRGSSRLLEKMPITEGHFSMPLGAGEYVLRPYLPEPRCWSGDPVRIIVSFAVSGPVPAALDVRNSCAAS
jgi:hypothetical protein